VTRSVAELDAPSRRAVAKALAPRMPGGYVPHLPTPKQQAFLLVDALEVFYGGAAGGGKSDALLMSALQYVDVPGYAAIIFRRTYTDLDRSREWLGGTDARFVGQTHTWHFPAGSSLSFGFMATEADKYRYKSAEFQSVGFDEGTQFSEGQYRYLFSRLRRPSGLTDSDPLARVPLRMRMASNPGDRGHAWVKARFIPRYRISTGDHVGLVEAERLRREGEEVETIYPLDEDGKRRIFIRALLSDNPHLDIVGYRANLRRLDPLEAARLEAGDWDATEGGRMFPREKATILPDEPSSVRRWIRSWDFAATDEKERDDPDYTSGAKIGVDDQGRIIVADVIRTRLGPDGVEKLVVATAELDGKKTSIRIEQEPGSSGKAVALRYVRQLLRGFDVKAVLSTGPKPVRAINFAAQWQAGNVYLVRGAWNAPYLDEMDAFPTIAEGVHDDQVDASVGGFEGAAGYKRTMRSLGVRSDAA
jgi:predicted phage terminase large subunit-like protein